MTKTTTKRFTKIRNAWKNRNKISAAAKDAGNKAWVLTVLGTLWGAAYVLNTATKETVPKEVKIAFACALAVLGLMWLVRNLRPRAVIE
jgi:hypothetical protein